MSHIKPNAPLKSVTKESDEDEEPSLASRTVGAILVIFLGFLVDTGFGTNFQIFDVFGEPFWRLPTIDGFTSLWFIPIWAFVISVVALILEVVLRKNNTQEVSPSEILTKGAIASVLAGVGEELIFRWLLFLASILTLTLGNFLFCGLPEWLFLNIFGPVANYGTLQMMTEYIFHPEGWVVGSAILGTSATFRESHAYQGLLGWVDSWFFAMVMFYLLFTHGLIVCVIAHFLFNITITLISAARAAFGVWKTR